MYLSQFFSFPSNFLFVIQALFQLLFNSLQSFYFFFFILFFFFSTVFGFVLLLFYKCCKLSGPSSTTFLSCTQIASLLMVCVKAFGSVRTRYGEWIGCTLQREVWIWSIEGPKTRVGHPQEMCVESVQKFIKNHAPSEQILNLQNGPFCIDS